MIDFWEEAARCLRDDFAEIMNQARADYLICNVMIGYGQAKKGFADPSSCEIKSCLIARPEDIAFPMIINMLTFFFAKRVRKPFFSSLVISLEIKPRYGRFSIKRLYEVKIKELAIYLKQAHVIREGWRQ